MGINNCAALSYSCHWLPAVMYNYVSSKPCIISLSHLFSSITFFYLTLIFSRQSVHCVSLCSHIWVDLKEAKKKSPMWSEVSRLKLTEPTPLSISGSLIAVGGRNKDHKAVNAIHLYQHETGKWVKVGDLPTPRRDCNDHR